MLRRSATAVTHIRHAVALQGAPWTRSTPLGASRLFAAGFRIEQVSLVTGHKDWKMLRRYTHLKPESLHDFAPRAA